MSTRQKNLGVLLLSPFFRPNIGGVETHLDDLCRYLTKHDYQVFVITYQPLTTKAQGLKVEKKKSLEARRVPWFGYNWFHKLEVYPFLDFLYLTIGLFFSSFFFLLKRKREIEIIHAQGLSTAFITKVLSKVFKKRKVASIHAIYKWKAGSLASRFAKWILSSFDSILTLSGRSKAQLVHMGIAGDRIQIYTYWVDQGLFMPLNKEECKRRLGWEDRFIVLFVGRFLNIKGIDLLLRVAKRVDPKISFAFV
ncbi:glycosyltransferase family 4 protein, partial [bacterium]|nr:glycosyltransferase family 4 protein [bacterium]